MLVLTRAVGDRIVIGGTVVVTVLYCRGGRIRLGIEAPEDVAVVREEILVGPASPVRWRRRVEGSRRPARLPKLVNKHSR